MSDFDFLRAQLVWYRDQYETACKRLNQLAVPCPQGTLVYRLGLVDTLPYTKPIDAPTNPVSWHHTGGRLQ